jgi:hypothetical protein
MSGVKVSAVRLEAERQRRLNLAAKLGELQAEVDAVREHLQSVLSQASEGLSSTFSEDVQRAEQWLRTDHSGSPGLSATSEEGALKSAVDGAERDAAAGRAALESVSVAFTQKADELGQKLARQVAEAEGRLLARRDLLRQWYGEDQVGALESELAEARAMLEREQYDKTESALSRFGSNIGKRTEFAEKQEEKQQRRLYLLKALRQTCAEMGFSELGDPQYEKQGDRGSRIVMQVDTLNRGRITFFLTLDGITTESEIADGLCAEEFDQVSEYLDKNFGVQTEFKMQDGRPIPRLIRKGEMDEPSGANIEMGAA